MQEELAEYFKPILVAKRKELSQRLGVKTTQDSIRVEGVADEMDRIEIAQQHDQAVSYRSVFSSFNRFFEKI